MGKFKERHEGDGDSGHTDIHQQVTSNSGTVGVLSDHIQSLRVGYLVQGWRMETFTVLAVDGGICPTEG